MTVIDFQGVGKLVGEGNYPVTLTKVSEKKNRTGDTVFLFQATIRADDDPENNGKQLFTRFTFKDGPEADNSNPLYYMQQTLLAFGADEEEVSGKVDPVKLGTSLYGNRAMANVVHNEDKNDPSKKYVNATFYPDGM